MPEFRKLKIGLAGLMCMPFRGDKQSQYAESGQGLEALAETLNFDLHIVPDGMYSLEDARKAAAELDEWGADFILIQTSSFGSGEFIYEFARLDAYLGLWAVPEGSPSPGGGLPLNSFTAANMFNSILGSFLTGYDRPVKWFFGRPGSDLFDDRLAITVRALTAIVNLRGTRLGLIGGVAPGFDNLIVNERELNRRLGIRVAPIEYDEAIHLAEQQEADRVKAAGETIRARAAHFDESQQPALEKSARVLLAYQQMAVERQLDALAISCWPRFQDHYRLAVCTVMGHLNEIGLTASCEGDVISAISMLALKYMSGGDIVTLMDLASFDPVEDSLLLWHCGPAPPSLADENGVTMQPLWLFDGYEGDSIGLHNSLILKPGPATVMGFTPDFSQMLVFDGVFDNSGRSYAGSGSWFKSLHLGGTAASVPELIQAVMSSGFQHHYPVVYGNYTNESLELAAWLGIAPIRWQPYQPYLIRQGQEARS